MRERLVETLRLHLVTDSALCGERGVLAVVEAAVEQERLEGWIMSEVDRGVPLPGLYPPNAEAKARYDAFKSRSGA